MILQLLQKSEEDRLDGTATGDEFWFQYFYSCSKISVGSPAEVISRARRAIGAKKNMITGFLTDGN
jgi:hypothetical protein